MTNILALVFILVFPSLLLSLSQKIHIIKNAGVVTLCYGLGFILSLFPIGYDKALIQTVASVAVALAIPLILFRFNLSSMKSLAKKTLLAFFLMIISVILVSASASLIWSASGRDNGAAFAGMTIGLYIGGTPNLFSVGTALLNDINLINLANISDSLLGGILFLCIITFIKNIYCKKTTEKDTEPCKSDISENAIAPLKKNNLGKLLRNVGIAIGCLCAGVGLEYVINGNLGGSFFIITVVSVLGIVFSCVKKVREVEETDQVGQYLILVFTTGLSMSLDLSVLKTMVLPVFLFFGCVQLGAMAVHFILCKIFKIDGPTALLTCVAGIYGPPFIVPVADSCNDKSLIVPGIICGTVGLAIGNLIGIGTGCLLAAL